MKLRSTLSALAAGFLALTSALGAQTSTEISPQDLRQRLFLIAHDSMGGRATGSEGNFKTASYVAAEFQRLGLAPGGDNGTYFQVIPFFRLKPDERLTLAVDGQALTLGRDFVPLRSARPPVALDGRPIVFGGSSTDTTTWISADLARGAVVLFTFARSGGRGLGRYIGLLGRSGRFRGASVLLIPALEQLPPEGIASFLEGGVMTDTTRAGTGPIIVFVSKSVAERMLGGSIETAKPGATGKPVSGSVGVSFFPLPFAARNVVAVIRGSDPALGNTYVSLSGHNDHVGFDHFPVDHDSLRAFDRVIRPMGADSPNRDPKPEEWREIRRILDSLRAIRPARADSIRNGADDDGTGTVALLEIAEKLAGGPQPRRSILFVNHAAEEEGLLGSAWYTDHATVPTDSIIGEIDMDMIGRGSATDLPDAGPAYLEAIGLRRVSRQFGDILDQVNARQPLPFKFNLTYDAPGHPLQYYCRADHYNYARYNIPAVAFSRGEHLDYHQVTDEAQYIDYDALNRVTRFVSDAALELANRSARPVIDHPKGDPHAACVQ
ncbi:MAG: M28 family peptidase [Gemmatimonadota bacterium]